MIPNLFDIIPRFCTSCLNWPPSNLASGLTMGQRPLWSIWLVNLGEQPKRDLFPSIRLFLSLGSDRAGCLFEVPIGDVSSQVGLSWGGPAGCQTGGARRRLTHSLEEGGESSVVSCYQFAIYFVKQNKNNHLHPL